MRYFLLILSLIFVISCSNHTDRIPKYGKFENAWEKDNLFGKIEELTEYKASFSDFQNKNTETPIPVFRKHYTEFGKILFQEHYDNFGNIDQIIKNEFNDKQQIIKSFSENMIMSHKSIELHEYDDSGNVIFTKAIFNDSIELIGKFEYDRLNNLSKQLSIQNSDTSITRFEYTYNEKGNILLKKQITKDRNSIYEYFNEFKYDSQGNLLELTNKSDLFGEVKITYEYDNLNRIKKKIEYESGQISKETQFDKYYNLLSIKYFESSALKKEMKYKYEFDNNGNWISRTAYLKEYFGESKKFQPMFIESREIEYYE